jgi:hypothetical protein
MEAPMTPPPQITTRISIFQVDSVSPRGRGVSEFWSSESRSGKCTLRTTTACTKVPLKATRPKKTTEELAGRRTHVDCGAVTFDAAAVRKRAIASAAGHHADAEIFGIPSVD